MYATREKLALGLIESFRFCTIVTRREALYVYPFITIYLAYLRAINSFEILNEDISVNESIGSLSLHGEVD